MCEFFDCSPTDIYEEREINLLAVRAIDTTGHEPPAPDEPEVVQKEEKPKKASGLEEFDGTGHEGMEQIRVWMMAEEKAALFKAVSALGYRSVAEWLREMYRDTLSKYITLKLQDRDIHEAVPPPTTRNQATGS
jgi:hypothetical protein